MTSLLRIIFLSALLLLLAACTSASRQRALVAERQGDLPSAIAALELHIQQQPRDARAFLELGELHARRRDWPAMLTAYGHAEAIDERWRRETEAGREYYYVQEMHRGAGAAAGGDHGEALSAFQGAMTLFPQRVQPQFLYGEAAWNSGDRQTARQTLEALIANHDDHMSARRVLMAIYFAEGQYARSLREAELLVDRFPRDETHRRLLAYSLDRLDMFERAQTAYQALIDKSANPADAASFAAMAYRAGQYDEAIALSRRAVELGGDELPQLRAIAQAHLMERNFPAIIQVANRMLDIEAENIAALQLLQLAHAALGQREEVEMISHRLLEAQRRRP